MSRKSLARRSIWVANNALGGSKATRAFRNSEMTRVINFCFLNGHPINSLADLTATIVIKYLKMPDQFDKSPMPKAGAKSSNSIATIHNKLSCIRRCMAALGVNPDERGITAEGIGLEQRSRKGTKLPIPDNIFFTAIAKASDLGEHGMILALKLERFLGLRGQEALMSIQVLKQYHRESLAYISSSITPEFRLMNGTKGGRPRVIRAVEKYAKEAVETITETVKYAANHGNFLIGDNKSGLKYARSLYHRLARQIGLVGVYAPHSLRYAYAVDKITELKDAGYSRKEALQVTASLLGHGPSRARYVSEVYGRTIVHKLPKASSRRSELNKLSKELAELEQDSKVTPDLKVIENISQSDIYKN